MCTDLQNVSSSKSSLTSLPRINSRCPEDYARVVHAITANQAASWAIAPPADSFLGLYPHHAFQRSSDRVCNSADLAFANPSAAEAEVVREEYVEEVPAIDGFSLSIVRK